MALNLRHPTGAITRQQQRPCSNSRPVMASRCVELEMGGALGDHDARRGRGPC